MKWLPKFIFSFCVGGLLLLLRWTFVADRDAVAYWTIIITVLIFVIITVRTGGKRE